MTISFAIVLSNYLCSLCRYIHHGSEDTADEFEIVASDGNQQASQTIQITIRPINDQIPQLLDGLITMVTIHEGEEVIITPEILSATDVDTNDKLLHFIVINPPKRGILVRHGVTTTRFRQLDIAEGYFKYKHVSGETGNEAV